MLSEWADGEVWVRREGAVSGEFKVVFGDRGVTVNGGGVVNV